MFGFNASVHFLRYLMKLLDSIIKASVFTLIFFFEAIEVLYIPPFLPSLLSPSCLLDTICRDLYSCISYYLLHFCSAQCYILHCLKMQRLICRTNVMDVAHNLSTTTKTEIQYLTEMLEKVRIFKIKLHLKTAWQRAESTIQFSGIVQHLQTH